MWEDRRGMSRAKSRGVGRSGRGGAMVLMKSKRESGARTGSGTQGLRGL